MSHQAEEDKPKPDHKKYLVVQFIGNLIGVVIVVAALACGGAGGRRAP